MAKTPPVVRSTPLPAGTVTFLFTDIEGSTRLWDTQHDAMRAAHARHDALLRQSIELHGGFIFKTVGDAFCAAFATAPDALAAALSAQQVLHTEQWPEPVRIRVRMALNTGASELREGDYFGPPLNRVARLLATGHGGQTLLSESTRELCRDRLPPGAALKALGEHSLKDLPRREVVFQLCHPDLPQTFPALKTLFAATDETTPSIAVLPFIDLSQEKDQEYFADGLAEELLNVLSKIRGLRVASRTSAFQFKGKDVDIPTVAQKLNVATVLEGSVRKAGKRVRITAQLIQVATDSHLWSESYDRDLDDIFAVQDDIAQSVVKEMRAALLGEKPDASASAAAKAEVQAAASGRSENVMAYRLYLQGRHLIDRRTRDDTTKGIDCLEQAVDLDPEFALAWAELGRAYMSEAGNGWAPVAESFGRAREVSARALALRPDLAEAHAQMGSIQMNHDWDWRGAEASYARALELAPGNTVVLLRAGLLASNLGRLDEAIGLYRRAIEQDPLSPTGYHNLGLGLEAADRVAEAEPAWRKALELSPQLAAARAHLALNLLAQGRREESLAEVLREPEEWARIWALAIIHDAGGRRAESDAELSELIAKHAGDAAYQIAEAYAARGEADRAFDWLERAYTTRDPGLSEMKTAPHLRLLRADPRWGAFLRKMGLAD